jgi:hypothetical protein
MSLRSGHGAGRGKPRIEVMPIDELPAGFPADTRDASPTDRGDHGRFAGGNSLASQGGKAKAGRVSLGHRLSLPDAPADRAFEPYRRAAVSFRRAQCRELSRSVGGGYLGPGPSSLVASAALQLAMSRFLSDHAGLDAAVMAQASRLANDSRQNLLAAHELCAREAMARKATAPAALPSWMQPEGDA